MKKTARIIAMMALVATILPALLYFTDRLTLADAKVWLLIAMVVWYLCAPLWMKLKPAESK
jgi:hypothetical protein